MKIEKISVENFKVFQKVEVEDIPNMAVFMGQNGVGKSTFFDIFGFLHDCLSTNVSNAINRRGGFDEVISREQSGTIKFEIKFRPNPKDPKVTYELEIGKKNGLPVIEREVMKMRRGQSGALYNILDFKNGEGRAAQGELKTKDDLKNANRVHQKLSKPDILAIKGLGQFEEFFVISAFRKLIEDWHVSDFHINEARRQSGEYSETLSKTGDNLAHVTKYIYEHHQKMFVSILEKMKQRIPGVSAVEAKQMEDGNIVLKFQDGRFKNPFSARFVSDGTIKMFSYLVLLNEPNRHALLCVEEPENQLYPELLMELTEEFREYSQTQVGGQVFISTHSPDFLNSVELDELFCLIKENGYTKIVRMKNSPQIKAFIDEGELLGYLWKRGDLLKEAKNLIGDA
ncbi:MAG: AAA family ATPase [Oscillospiraceae bacterium]|nr:AAA family ATPase [Oscillospiraceae bacterium]MCL2247628.1 AAA family ATPase [Lentimicrobiaceae bacterium]